MQFVSATYNIWHDSFDEMFMDARISVLLSYIICERCAGRFLHINAVNVSFPLGRKLCRDQIAIPICLRDGAFHTPCESDSVVYTIVILRWFTKVVLS